MSAAIRSKESQKYVGTKTESLDFSKLSETFIVQVTPTRPVELKLNAMRLSFIACGGPI